MAKETNTETRAVQAALETPTPFRARAGAMALHAAERHVDRWAPEQGATSRSRSLRSLAFVDRLVTPWVETAQRSASLRVFGEYQQRGWGERPVAPVSWVFPRPWYQDELDWMAAARTVASMSPGREAISTRGTFLSASAPAMAPQSMAPMSTMSMSAPISMDLVAPSLSIATTSPVAVTSGGRVGEAIGRVPAIPPAALAARPLAAWSPLVSFQAAQAAQIFAAAIGQAQQSGLATAERSPILGALSYVAPSELGARAPQEAAMAPRFAAERAPGAAPVPSAASTVAMQAQLASTLRQIEAVRAQSAAPAAASTPQAPAGDAAAPVVQAATIEAARVEHAREQAETAAAIAAPAPTAPPPALESFAPSAAGTGMTPAAIASLAQTIASSSAASGALRGIELLARGAATGVALAPIGGPRVAMPAGLGGLMSAVDTASAVQRPMTAAVPAMAAASRAAAAPATSAVAPTSFAPVWAMPAAGGALGAIAGERPAAVGHVAWADRWLARFAGASPGSLAALDAVTAPASFTSMDSGPLMARSLAAPGAVYVAPAFADRGGGPSRSDDARDTFAPRAAARPSPRFDEAPAITPTAAPPPLTAAPRFDDAESVPDDVFAAIMRPQAAPVRPVARATAAAATPAAQTFNAPSIQLVDRIAHAAPSAPGAGLHAQLASSPIAPALSALLSLPSAPSFDARALFTDGLVASYLEGVLSPSLRFATASSPDGGAGAAGGAVAWPMPGLAAFASPYAAMESSRAQARSFSRLAALAPDAAYVSPLAPPSASPDSIGSTDDARPELARASIDRAASARRDDASASVEPGAMPAAEQAATMQAAIAAAHAAAIIAVRAELLGEASPAAYVASPIAPDSPAARAFAPRAATAGAPAMPWVTPVGAEPGAAPAAVVAARPTALASSLDAPLAAAPRASWTGAPGMTGAIAHSWSVEQERSSADLSFDFVAPEIVLAARVYGFGPAEAAQAQRLALAGPSGLAAMASALDLTFLRAMQSGADARAAFRAGDEPRATAARGTIARTPGGAMMTVVAPSLEANAPSLAGDGATETFASPAAIALAGAPVGAREIAPTTAYPISAIAPTSAAAPAPGERAQLFGVEKRLPRGAFLWPAATVGAVGLHAITPEGLATLPVAALELLAASAVADLGAWVVARENAGDKSSAFSTAFDDAEPHVGATRTGARPSMPGPGMAAVTAGAVTSTASASAGLGTLGAGLAPELEPSAEIVAAAALPTETSARRARFESVYLAISQSTDGRSLSPTARAARALAILSRSDDAAPTSSVERAAAAWQMIPLVLSGDAPSARAAGDTAPLAADSRPGMQPLASRAGDAIGAFVTPTRAELTGSASSSGSGRGARAAHTPTYVQGGPDAAIDDRAERVTAAATRAPSTAAELVRTGVPFARHGGGEAEIPAWFEAAARKVLASQSPGSDISLAELTLVTSAPAKTVAADMRGSTASSTPAAPAAHGSKSGEKPDVDAIATEVYARIRQLIDIVRERNGEPYQ